MLLEYEFDYLKRLGMEIQVMIFDSLAESNVECIFYLLNLFEECLKLFEVI